jgi:hypothetical protein
MVKCPTLFIYWHKDSVFVNYNNSVHTSDRVDPDHDSDDAVEFDIDKDYDVYLDKSTKADDENDKSTASGVSTKTDSNIKS